LKKVKYWRRYFLGASLSGADGSKVAPTKNPIAQLIDAPDFIGNIAASRNMKFRRRVGQEAMLK